jgi:hypothetical protein
VRTRWATGQMEPKFLGGEQPDVAGKTAAPVLAEWLTAPENPYFATNVANRVWAHFFGRGIVEPVDDIRVSNPPSNPELFEELGRKLVEYKYDFKQLVRDICNSEAYQRSFIRNESNEHDERNFAHAGVRRIPAEQMLDCLNQVTETQEKFRGLPLGARAVQIADGHDQQLLPDVVRARASRDGLRLRGHDRSVAVASAAHAERRRRARQDPTRRPWSRSCWTKGRHPSRSSNLYHPLLDTETDGRRSRAIDGAGCPGCQSADRLGRCHVGHPELPRVLVQSLTESFNGKP